MPSNWWQPVWQVCGWAPQRQWPVVEEEAGEACECGMMASRRTRHAAGKRFSSGHTRLSSMIVSALAAGWVRVLCDSVSV